MYNRYVPQSDGSHSRRRIPSDQPRQPKPPASPPEPPCEKPQTFLNCTARQETGAMGFLRSLLPKDFDTGDLIVILLLLLLAGDCEEDRSTALLTLALYCFL